MQIKFTSCGGRGAGEECKSTLNLCSYAVCFCFCVFGFLTIVDAVFVWRELPLRRTKRYLLATFSCHGFFAPEQQIAAVTTNSMKQTVFISKTCFQIGTCKRYDIDKSKYEPHFICWELQRAKGNPPTIRRSWKTRIGLVLIDVTILAAYLQQKVISF